MKTLDESKFDKITDAVEFLKTDLDVTQQFQNLIMDNFEDTNPDVYKVQEGYRQMQTLGWVLFDRLVAMANKAKELLDMLYK